MNTPTPQPPIQPDEAAKRVANVITSTKCDLIADGPIVLGQAVLTAIREGWVPGVVTLTSLQNGPHLDRTIHAMLSEKDALLATLQAELAEARGERDQWKAAVETMKTLQSGKVQLARDYDQAIAEREAVKWLLERCRPHIRYDKGCQCSGCDGLRQLNERIDAVLGRT